VKAVAGDPSNKEFQNIPTIAAAHHEKPYGGVYPYGMAEDEIRLCSQIMTIFDAFTASERPL
jgi:HD-GYP domain-containing protein (c-di-GMP phosphodiesterase class II)